MWCRTLMGFAKGLSHSLPSHPLFRFANMEGCMPVFKLPLSGDVMQNISPFTAFMSPIGSQFGLINITLGQSSAPDVEKDVLSDVGTYGKQIGQIGDALLVLIER